MSVYDDANNVTDVRAKGKKGTAYMYIYTDDLGQWIDQ
jgi:hypothetical protein